MDAATSAGTTIQFSNLRIQDQQKSRQSHRIFFRQTLGYP
jgi:hypothetical protein